MEDRKGDLERGIAQVRIEGVELIRGAERLVGDRAKRERCNVGASHALGSSARSIGAFLRLVRAEPERPNEHELLDPRHGRERPVAERIAVDGNLPPPGEPDPLRLARGFDPGPSTVVAQKDHREAAPRPGHERRRDRQQDARTVSRLAIGGDRPAVTHPPQPLQRPVEQLARRSRVQVRDKADATGVELGSVGRVGHGRALQRCV